MTQCDKEVERALTDARALLEALLISGWQDVHVVSGGTEIFIARPGGRDNPLRRQVVAVGSTTEPVAGETEILVAAQHVATLVDVLAVGAAVRAGEKVATIRVLDVEEDLLAPVAGRIAEAPVQPGALVEFGMTILRIAEAA
jgi:biotin carboxyl carrier protein